MISRHLCFSDVPCRKHIGDKVSCEYCWFWLITLECYICYFSSDCSKRARKNQCKGGKPCLHSWFQRNLSPSRQERQGTLCTAAGMWGLCLFTWQEEPKQHNFQNCPSVTSCQLGPISQSCKPPKQCQEVGTGHSNTQTQGTSHITVVTFPNSCPPKSQANSLLIISASN